MTKTDYHNLIDEFKVLNKEFNYLLDKEGLLDNIEFEKLTYKFSELINLLDDPNISRPLDNLSITPKCKIDSYGLGSSIIELIESGMNTQEISKLLSVQCADNISPIDIDIWLEEYNQSSISQKPKVIKGSIFDARNRMEEMHSMLIDLLSKVEQGDDNRFKSAKVTKEQVTLSIITEIRQTIKQASDILEKVESFQTVKEFQKMVIDCLREEAPSTQMRVMMRLKEMNAMNSMMGLPDSI